MNAAAHKTSCHRIGSLKCGVRLFGPEMLRYHDMDLAQIEPSS